MKKINFKKIKRETQERMERYKVKKKVKKKDKVEKVKPERKRKRFRFWYWLTILITFFAIILFVLGVGFCYYIVTSAPEFDKQQMFEKEVTRIFDSKNNLIATLGTEQREKITYDEIPEVLVDAIIATEDSRFFQHNGFDAPRFLKASIQQVLGRGGGGASTLTMQLSKLAFTSTESSGIQGIIRKFTDIYMSVFQIEKNFTKEEIIEYYVNIPCMGGNIYGVEQASQYYFGKNAKDLNLVEAAMIAGMFQSPNGYNAYVNPNDANERKNTVLYLMKRHGYITDLQYEAGISVEIKDFLAEGNTSINEYQGFIDTVVQEVIDKTGNNPYDVPMDIYTTMDKTRQDAINDFYKTYKFKDKKIEVGIGVIDNKTGAIVAVGAGRNKTSAMTLNVATFWGQTKRMPGSTIKPILDYGPAIEYANLSTYGPFIDEKTPYGTGYMRNFNNSYSGFMTMYDCLRKSINTCALQAFGMTSNEEKIEFAKNLGIDLSAVKTLPQSYSIGAFNGVSPVQLAAAYSAFGNGGYYTSPYSFKKIVYRETDEEYVQDISKKRVMKAQTAYMITSVLRSATSSSVSVSGTQIATKTGTTSYDDNQLRQFGLSSSVIPDSWTSSYSPDYAMAIWYGYTDGLTKDAVKKKHYLLNGHATSERIKIQAKLAKKIYPKNSKFKSPGGLVTTSVELETIPAQKPSANTPSKLKGTFTFISGTEPSEVSTRFSTLTDPNGLTYVLNNNLINLSWNTPGTPSAIDNAYLTEYFNNGYSIWAEDYLNKRIKYNNKNIGTFGFDIYLTSGTNSTYVGWTDQTSYTIDLNNYQGIFDGVIVKSAYKLFKTNASRGVSVVFNSSVEQNYNVVMNGLSLVLNIGDKYKELNTSNVSSITLNGEEIKSGVSGLSVITTSIVKEGSNVNITPDELTNTSGTYKVTYTVSFSYMGSGSITRTFTQTVAVNP